MSHVCAYLTDYRYIIHTKEISGQKLALKSQLSAMNEAGVQVEIVDVSTDTTAFFARVHACIPFLYSMCDWSKVYIPERADSIYIKRFPLDYPFIRLLSRIKCANPNVKIILEVPDNKLLLKKTTTWYEKSIQKKDRFYCKKLKKYVDRIVTYTDDKEIYGVPCININHGVDFQALSLRDTPSITDNKVQLLIISEFLPEYKYERLLDGIYEYNTHAHEGAVHIHFVGYGPMLNEYKRRIALYNLENNVTIHGVNDEQFRERLFRQCHIGVDVLGSTSQPETRASEFLARGLPYITTQAVPPYLQQFTLTLPDKASPIDIAHVLRFYSYLCTSEHGDSLANEIRILAEQQLEVRTAYQPVINFLNNSLTN